MDPKARAEARRQAILGRGAKRLAKLTFSARGGESTASNDDRPLPEAIVTRSSELPSKHPQLADLRTQPRQFIESPSEQLEKNESGPSTQEVPGAPFQPPSGGVGHDEIDHPFSSLLSSLMDPNSPTSTSPFNPSNGMKYEGSSIISPSKHIIHFLPFIRLLAVVVLLIFFLSRYDPAPSDSASQYNTGYRRWSVLKHYSPIPSPTIQVAPLVQSLLAFEISWYTLCLLLGCSGTAVPTLIKLVLPLAPPPFPHAITIVFQYTNLAQGILDDLSVILAIMGLVISFAG